MKTNQLNYLRENILEEALCFLAYKNKFKNRKQSLKNFIFGNEFNLFSNYNCNHQLTKKEISEVFNISVSEVYKLKDAVILEFKNYINQSQNYKEAA